MTKIILNFIIISPILDKVSSRDVGWCLKSITLNSSTTNSNSNDDNDDNNNNDK